MKNKIPHNNSAVRRTIQKKMKFAEIKKDFVKKKILH